MAHKPILIIGFERSGTTLLRRVVSMCPALDYDLLHERKRLIEYGDRLDAERLYNEPVKEKGEITGATASILAGEKLAYRTNTLLVEAYIERWFDWWPDGIGFHIFRNARDCAKSAKRAFNRDEMQTINIHRVSVPKVIEKCSQYPQMHDISYEAMVGDPLGMVQEIYGKIGADVSDGHIMRVLSERDRWEHNGRIMCGLRYKQGVR